MMLLPPSSVFDGFTGYIITQCTNVDFFAP